MLIDAWTISANCPRRRVAVNVSLMSETVAAGRRCAIASSLPRAVGIGQLAQYRTATASRRTTEPGLEDAPHDVGVIPRSACHLRVRERRSGHAAKDRDELVCRAKTRAACASPRRPPWPAAQSSPWGRPARTAPRCAGPRRPSQRRCPRRDRTPNVGVHVGHLAAAESHFVSSDSSTSDM